MGTTATTTVAAVQAAFVTAATAEVPAGVTVWRTWPGQSATQRMVFFTEAEWTGTDEAAIKTGRRWRDESYDLNLEIWHLEQGSPDGGATAIDDVLAIYNACEEAVVKAGSTVRTVDGVVSVVCQPVRMEPIEVGTGWGVVMTARLAVEARLT